MSLLINNHFVWKIILIFCVATICQAQTKCPEQTTNKDNNTNQTVTEKKESLKGENLTEECDFSSFNTLKEMPGGIIQLPTPDYPKEAKTKKITGNVTLRVLVNREGQIVKVCKLEGNDILAQSAIKAAKLIKFTSGYAQRRLEGKKQEFIEFTLTYNFNPDDN